MGREMREARQQCGHSCGVEAEKPYTAPAAQAGVESQRWPLTYCWAPPDLWDKGVPRLAVRWPQ